MDDIVALRCKYCGAPLNKSELEADSHYITCSSCGTTQQRVDAKAYLDQMMGQVQAWISKAIPGGFSMSQADNVDSIARYNIFTANIKPRIEAEYTEYKFAVNTLISHPLIILPFTTSDSVKPSHTSTKAFEFNAKVKSIEPLAVDDACRGIVSDAENLASGYALLINNIKLLEENKDGRYILMANNFAEISAAFSRIKGYGLAAKRFTALSDVCTGCEKLLNGLVAESISYLEKGMAALEALKTEIMSDFNMGIMYQAVEQETAQANILKEMASFVISGTGQDPLKTLNVVQRVFTFNYPKSGKWGYFLGNKDRFNEIFGYLADALKAKNGGSLLIASGSGDYLVPFWDIDLKYSFQTGAAWKKKSVEVAEDLLVPADFVIDPDCLRDPSSAVTAIFSEYAGKNLIERLAGNETSISGGQGIGALSDTAAQNSPGARKIVVPLSTKREAENIVGEYLAQCMAGDSKLKLSNPKVKALIYIPCKITDRIEVPDGFGKLVPRRVGRTNTSEIITI